MPDKKYFRKSQMEIMGLAIVVLLITIGMLFVVKINIGKKPAEFKAEFTSKQLAQNTVTAFLSTNTSDCSGMSITELLQDCVQSQTDCDNGEVSCLYVKNAASEIFEKTLDTWKADYYFSVYFPDERAIIELGEECKGDKKPGWGYTPTARGTLYTKLDICG